MLTQTYRFSVADFYRMAETGILREDARVELIDGEIVPMMPTGPFHASLVTRLTFQLNQLAANRWLTWAQNPLRLSEHSELQPDIALVVARQDFYKQKPPEARECFLIIEVADTSVARDREEKLPLYARAGIEEV